LHQKRFVSTCNFFDVVALPTLTTATIKFICRTIRWLFKEYMYHVIRVELHWIPVSSGIGNHLWQVYYPSIF